MYKNLDLGSHDPVTHEPRVSLLNTDADMTKVASEVQQFVIEVKPKPGRTFLHVIALGAYEYYGANRNKDAFAESHNGPEAEVNLPKAVIHEDYAGLIEQFKGMPVTSKVEPGTKVYETFNSACAYKHHKNKDPNKRIGDVVKAFYNHDMHRVELIIELHNSKCQEFIDRLDRGDRLAFSMGCHIKYDVCSVCGNRAPRRSDYCEHARNMHRREFDDNGMPICVFNPNARFFDISIVFRPADRIGYMIKKVANHSDAVFSADAGEAVLRYNAIRKVAAKLSAFDKIIRGDVEGVHQLPESLEIAWKAIEPLEIDSKRLDPSSVDGYSLGDLAKTAYDVGVPLSSSEVFDLVYSRHTGEAAGDALLKAAAAHSQVAMQCLADNPDILDSLLDTGMFDGSYSDKIAALIQPLADSRGIDRSNLLKQASMAHKPVLETKEYANKGGSPAATDMYHVLGSDGMAVTNRDAVDAARTRAKARSAAKAVGAGVLTGAAYRAVMGRGGVGAGLLGSGATAAYDVVRSHSGKPLGNSLPTEEGPKIPRDTLLFNKQSALLAARSTLLDYSQSGNTTNLSYDLPSDDEDFNKVAELLGRMILGSLKR